MPGHDLHQVVVGEPGIVFAFAGSMSACRPGTVSGRTWTSMPAASISGSRYSVKSGSLRAQSAKWRWLRGKPSQGEGWRLSSPGMENAPSRAMYLIWRCVLHRQERVVLVAVAVVRPGRPAEDLQAPPAEAGRSGGLRGARLAVIQALVLGDHSV